jgi:hypothetical protein
VRNNLLSAAPKESKEVISKAISSSNKGTWDII